MGLRTWNENRSGGIAMKRPSVSALALLFAVVLCVPAEAAGRGGASQGRQNLKKEARTNPRLPDFTDIFNWGLKIEDLEELYLFAGIAAQRPDFSVVEPFDYVAQTDYILNELDLFLSENALDRDDIIRIEFTLVDGITEADFGAVLNRFSAYFQNVEVRPAAGTLRFVHALASPGLVVEYEIWCAR